MKIVVVSDTHRDKDVLFDIISRNRTADLVVHLGDGEDEYEDARMVFPEIAFLYVRGNNDWGMYPTNQRITLCGHGIYMCHGHSFDRSSLRSFLAATAKVNKCDIALFGHTHVPVSEEVNGVHIFNPGSPHLPRGGNPPTYGIINLSEDGKAEFLHKEIK